MRHIYLWTGATYGSDIISRLESGTIQFSRPFGLGYTEASLVFQASSEADAYAEFPKGLKVKITEDSLTGDRYDGTSLLVGYVDRRAWNEATRTVRVVLKDKLYLSLDKKIGPVSFVGQHLSEIIDWIAGEIGITALHLPSSAYDPLIDYHYWDETTVQTILNEIAGDLGGKLYCSVSEPHVLVVEYGCLYDSYVATPLLTIDLDDVDDFTVDYPARLPNVFEIEGTRKKLVYGILFEGANLNNPWTITTDGVGVTNDHYIEFENNVVYVDEVVFDADSGIEFDETVWAANFIDGDDAKPLINPRRAKIKITASSEGEVWSFQIKGRAVHEDKQVETKDDSGSDPQRHWKLVSNMVFNDSDGSWSWLKRRVSWEAAKPGDEFSFGIVSGKFPFFGPHVSISPDYIMEVSGANIAITDMTLNLASGKIQVHGVGDRSGYDPLITDGYEDVTSPIIPIIPDIPPLGDGEAPAVPAGLTVTAFADKNRSYIKATWDENTEDDLLGYEVRWSYDNTNWKNSGFTNNNEIVIEVTTQWVSGVSYTAYVQVRAVDIENLKSDWSASDSDTIVYDTTAPGMPGAITATGGVGLIYIKWGAVYDSDVEQYFIYRKIQVSNGGPFSDWIAIATVKGTEYIDESVEYHIQNSPEDPTYPNQWRKYIYAVRAADYSNNGSSRREMSTANAVYATQATGPDIAVKAIKANHLEVALDLSVGRQVTVGSEIQIGADVGPAGSTFDGIYVTDGTNYVKMSASFIKLKANLILGQGDNEIYFEDAGIHLKDAGFGAEGGRLQYFGNTPEDTGETQKVFYDLLYHKDSSGNLDWSNLLLRTDISNKYCTIKMEARNGTNYYEKMGLISTTLAKSTTGSIYPEIQFRIYSNDEGYITASHPFKLPTYDLNTSLPTLPCGCIALKELTTGNFWLVWSDGSRWFAPDGRTLLA